MTISRKNIRLTLLMAGLLLSLYLLWVVRNGLYPFFIAFFLAYLLNPAVNALERRGVTRGWAITLVYLVLFSFLIIGGSLLIPVLVRELENFGRELPQMTGKVEELLYTVQARYQQSVLPYSLRDAMDNGLIGLQAEGQVFVAELVAGIIDILTHFIGLVISPVLAFYLLHDWHEIEAEFLRVMPSRWRQDIVLLFRDVDRVLAGVIRGQVTVAVIVGILVSIGLYLLGVRYALLIGILAGMLDIIPYFGAIIGATPGVTVALLDSPWLALKVVALFFIIHQLEGTIIGPKIMGENVGLHPLSVIFYLFIGGELGGLLGLLLGVPVAAVVKVLLRHLFRLLV